MSKITRMARDIKGDGFVRAINAIRVFMPFVINATKRATRVTLKICPKNVFILTLLLTLIIVIAPIAPAADTNTSTSSTSTGTGTKFVQIEDARFMSPDLWVTDADKTVGGHELSDLSKDKEFTIGGEPATFHVDTLLHGAFGGDCFDCHRIGGIAPHDVQIDMGAFETSVHAGLNHNATYNATMTSPMNKACWACHGNGTEPDDHPPDYWDPYPCVTCHEHNLFDAPPIYEHFYKGGSGVGIDIRVECVDCHLNGTADHEIIPDMSCEAEASHYASRDILPATDNCSVCHQDVEGGVAFGAASQVFAHDKDGACDGCHGVVKTFHDRELVIPPENTCKDCHTSAEAVDKYGTPGQIRTHYPGAPAESVDTTKVDETLVCDKCHNGTIHSPYLTRHLNASNETVFKGYCFDCHAEGGTFPYPSRTQINKLSHGKAAECMAVNCIEPCHNASGVSRFHEPTDVVSGYFGLAPSGAGSLCTDCHPKHMRLGEFEEEVDCLECHPEYLTAHYSDAIVEEVNKTYTCALCHNKNADKYHNLTYTYGEGGARVDESCYTCHDRDTNFTESQTLTYGSGDVRGGIMVAGEVKEVNVAEAFTCTECHNVTDTPFHYSPYPLGSPQDPGWDGWAEGVRVRDCKDCHTYYGGKPPFNATDMSGTSHGYEEDCYVCHGGRGPITFHTLEVFDVTPHVSEISITPNQVHAGESAMLNAKVVTGWKMEVRYIEYFVDIPGERGEGAPLTFTRTEYYGQATEATVVVNTTGWSQGKHTIFVQSLDSRGIWSDPRPVMLTVTRPKGVLEAMFLKRELLFIGAIAIIILIIAMLYGIRGKRMK